MATITNMLIVTLPANIGQQEWEAAMDWVNARAVPDAEGTFVDHGDVHVWLFPAA
jgi:hypothetical protein